MSAKRATFEYLEEGVTSDVTFRARAGDLDQLFLAAADATTGAMVRSVDSIATTTSRPVFLTASEPDLLLRAFLDEIVYWKDAEQLLLRATKAHVRSESGHYELEAELRGERIDPERHELEADVKAVTLAGLRVERTAGGWLAEVTLDV